MAEARLERRYFKTYYDFLYNGRLNGEEKLIFVALKSFLDFSMDKNGTKGEAYPTIKTLCGITDWGKQKVIDVIKSLVKKNVVKKIRRGFNKSNLYIIADYEEMWTDKSPEAVKKAETDDKNKSMTLENYITEIEKMGYEVEVRKTEPAPASDAITMPESRKTEPASASNATIMPENKKTGSVSASNTTTMPESRKTEPVSTSNITTNKPKSQVPYQTFKANVDEPKSQEQNSMSKSNADESKNQKQDSATKSDADALLNRLWKLYPVKKGKGRISAAQKKKLLKIGYDEMARAIERYKQYVESVDYLHYQYGSTFFNGGYVDYLDANYDPESEPKAKSSPEIKHEQKKNWFNDYPTREYDFDEITRNLFNQSF